MKCFVAIHAIFCHPKGLSTAVFNLWNTPLDPHRMHAIYDHDPSHRLGVRVRHACPTGHPSSFTRPPPSLPGQIMESAVAEAFSPESLSTVAEPHRSWCWMSMSAMKMFHHCMNHVPLVVHGRTSECRRHDGRIVRNSGSPVGPCRRPGKPSEDKSVCNLSLRKNLRSDVNHHGLCLAQDLRRALSVIACSLGGQRRYGKYQ
jgi:hypothetical protein